MNANSKIFIAGHKGLVGSAIVRALQAKGYHNLLLVDRSQVDLINQAAVHHLFNREKVQYVFVAAARVGGIHANSTYPADFIFENLTIASNIIHASHVCNVEKLLYLGSSCIYPKNAPQPIREEYLLTGPLEETNEAYAIAKIAGLKLCKYFSEQYGKRFISAMPTNLYGPNDNFDEMTSHVLPSLLRRFHLAKVQHLKEVKIWGSGKPRREFLHADDLASALFTLMEKHESSDFVNVGCGEDIQIKELAALIAKVVGFKGEISYNLSMPDGTPRKLLEVSKIKKLGWEPSISLEEGIRSTYAWALKNAIFEKLTATKVVESQPNLSA